MSGVKFIRRGGKVIPIGLNVAGNAQKAVSSAKTISRGSGIKKQPVKPKQGLKWGSTALGIASGVLGAATLTSGGKAIAAATAAGIGLDVASTSLNVAAHAGKGNTKARAKAFAKHEALNQALGWGVFAAGLVGFKKNRTLIKNFAVKTANFIRRTA